MSADLQMARGAVDGETNLAIGEPFFLRELFTKRLNVKGVRKECAYPAIGGEPELLEELHRRHQYKHIVVTNGAKQALEAAFYAFKTVEHKTAVFHQAPYWPSYPTLAQSRGLSFNYAAPYENQIFCVTSPNNPDGAQPQLLKRMPDLWDAAYAQPVYGYFGVPPPHRVAVFSAAKLLGLSGLRIGWICTNDDKLAAAMSYFVEITTSGVNTWGQMHVASCLEALRDYQQMEKMTLAGFEARAALMANGSSFTELIGDLTEQFYGVPRDGSGMFAWFKVRRPEAFRQALAAARVKLVTGEACGQVEDGWFRMSMGHDPEITRTALIQVRQEYRK